MNEDLNFQVSLARRTLQVDTVPTRNSIGALYELLLRKEKRLVQAEVDGRVNNFEGQLGIKCPACET